jgi:hypothetical protein
VQPAAQEAAGRGASPVANGFAAAHAHAAAAGADSKVVYSCRTVVMKFRDPTLPHQLSKILKVNTELLLAFLVVMRHAAHAGYTHLLHKCAPAI